MRFTEYDCSGSGQTNKATAGGPIRMPRNLMTTAPHIHQPLCQGSTSLQKEGSAGEGKGHEGI